MRLDNARPLAFCLNACVAVFAAFAACFIADAAFINADQYAHSAAVSSFLLGSFFSLVLIFVICAITCIFIFRSILRDPYTYDDDC